MMGNGVLNNVAEVIRILLENRAEKRLGPQVGYSGEGDERDKRNKIQTQIEQRGKSQLTRIL